MYGAGQAATQRVIETLLPTIDIPSIELDLRVAIMPSPTCKDAGDLVLEIGREQAGIDLKKAVTDAVGWKQWVVDRLITQSLKDLKAALKLKNENNQDKHTKC